jgi:hypothetical protein
MNMAKKRILATICSHAPVSMLYYGNSDVVQVRTTGSHHPGSFQAGLLFHWPSSGRVEFAMLCRVRASSELCRLRGLRDAAY